LERYNRRAATFAFCLLTFALLLCLPVNCQINLAPGISLLWQEARFYNTYAGAQHGI